MTGMPTGEVEVDSAEGAEVDEVADGTAASAAGEAPAPAWAALGPDPSPDQLARYVAVGVHAHAQLLLHLPAVAQGHHARAGAPGPSAPSRGH